MKIIIAGSRSITDYNIVERAVINSGYDITEVVSGCAKGVDTLGEQYAQKHNIPIKRFPAEWHHHGKSAGPIRNQIMADYADGSIVVWDGESRGSQDMMKRTVLAKKPIYTMEIWNFSFEHMMKGINNILDQIKQSGKTFTAVYGIPKGGMIPATIIAYRLGLPMIQLSDFMENAVLIVDDIIDSGKQISEMNLNSKHGTIATLMLNEDQDKVSGTIFRGFGFRRSKFKSYVKFWWE